MKTKQNDDEEINLDFEIKWKELAEMLEENRHPSIFGFFKMLFNYSYYASLANFGSDVVNKYHIPFSKARKL